MKVKAKRLGYYNLRRQKEDSVFFIKSEDEFSSEWMEKVDSEKPKKVSKASKNKPADSEKPEEVI